MTGRAPEDPAGLLRGIVPAHAPGAQLVVVTGNTRLADAVIGREDDDHGPEVGADTRFDLASLTKLFTAATFMRLVERGAVNLDAPVRRVLPEAGGRSAASERITWRHLLSHSAGLPPGVPYASMTDAERGRAAVLSVEPTHAPGATVVYSDVGFMLLGFAIEAIVGRDLGPAIDELVVRPLGLRHTGFLPNPSLPVAATEVCPHRRRRLRAEVHDENAAALGGIAGHAGLFSTARDIAALGASFLDGRRLLLAEETVAEMICEQARDDSLRRGLGFALWSPDPEASSHPLGRRSFGHTGFTGTSLWVDPDRSMVVALLTNAVYRGRGFAAFSSARVGLHESLATAVGAGQPSMEVS